MFENTLAAHLLNNHLRVEEIVWIGGNLACASDKFKEFINSVDPEYISRVIGIPISESDLMGDPKELMNKFRVTNRIGFLVSFSTPTPYNPDKTEDIVYDWEHVAIHWEYAEAIDHVPVVAAILWREGYIAKRLEAVKKEIFDKIGQG